MLSTKARHRVLDDSRNPWRYVWRCAAYGCTGRPCTRCGLRNPIKLAARRVSGGTPT